MRRLLWFLFIIGLLFVVADTAARNFAGNRIETQIASSLNIGSRPEVSIGGFPFLWALFSGRFEEVTITSERVRAERVELTDVSLVLSNVRFSAAEAVGGQLDRVTIGSGRGQAVITPSIIQSALAEVPESVRPSLEEGVTLNIEGNEIVLGPIRIPLPEIGDDVQFESARVEGGEIHLTFSVGTRILRL